MEDQKARFLEGSHPSTDAVASSDADTHRHTHTYTDFGDTGKCLMVICAVKLLFLNASYRSEPCL